MARPFEDEEDPTPRSVPPKKPAAPKPASPATPPAKAGAKPVPPIAAAPVAPAGPKKLPWGHAGSVNTPGELSDLTGRPGVVRLVGAGVHYDVPPLDRHVWMPALEQPGRYEMPWTEGDPADVRTIADLAADLRGPQIAPNKLHLLDNVADTLLRLTEQLHEHGWRLGLLHAANVLIVPNTDGRELVLPDVGFTWRGGHGSPPWKDNPGRPSWLEEDRGLHRNAKLWDQEPVYQQFVCENDAGVEVAPETSDLKTLARLFTSLHSGQPERDVPRVPPTPAPAWATLHAVMNGEIQTASQFRTALRKTPLGTLWSTPKEAPPKKSKAPLVLLLLFLFLLCGGIPVGLFGAWKYGWFATTTPTTTQGTFVAAATQTSKGTPAATQTKKTTPNGGQQKRPDKDVPWRNKPSGAIPTESELVALMKEYEATKDPKKRAEILGRMYRIHLLNDPALREREWHWIEYLRGQYVTEWVGRYKAADDRVQKDVSQRFSVAKELSDLNLELDTLRQKSPPYTPSLDEREKQCLDVSSLRVTELGSPR